MAGEKRGAGKKNIRTLRGYTENQTGTVRQNESGIKKISDDESPPDAFFRNHALSLVIFFLSFFFIITVTNPAIYMNDEWVTANQLHQLDIGHQVTFSEGKYGVTQNGTVSAYFTSRQNILGYSLALPVASLPMVRLFGLLGDNFRLIVILAWSLCLILAALLLDIFYPAYSRIHGTRILFPVLLLALLLFMGNVLLYKQFPFSAPDAPYEVAALVLTNQIFFALMVSVVFETMLVIFKNIWMALFSTLASVSCSSYLFWAAAAKDHILTTLVFSLIIYTFILYLSRRKQRDAVLAFVFSGLLVWIRPEMGFFVTIILGICFIISLITTARSTNVSARRLLISAFPALGVFIGLIPFFINNTMISHNWLIPAFDLPRDLVRPGSDVRVPLPLSQVVIDPSVVNKTSDLTLVETFSRAYDMVVHAMFGGITFENLVRGFIGMLTFPENHSIGFLILCPLVVIGLCALVLWGDSVVAGIRSKKEVMVFVFLMTCAVFFSYLTKFNSMNISLGVLPDMRYLSPAYLPCGLLSMYILSTTPILKISDKKIQSLLKCSFWGSIVLLPVLFYIMLFVQPFGNDYMAYATFFKISVIFTLVLCLGGMILSRIYSGSDLFFRPALPFLLVLVILTVFSFQIMLTSFYAVIVKINGYPFWMPLIREGVRLFMEIQYLPPV